MKIGGRIIKGENIFETNSTRFFAKYKGHEIHVNVFKENERSNDEYSYTIIKIITTSFGGNNKTICSGILQRCNIRDVIIYALNEAEL